MDRRRKEIEGRAIDNEMKWSNEWSGIRGGTDKGNEEWREESVSVYGWNGVNIMMITTAELKRSLPFSLSFSDGRSLANWSDSSAQL